MMTGLPYTALRDAVLTHATLVEGLIPLVSSVPSTSQPGNSNDNRREGRQSRDMIPTAAGRASN